MEIRIGHSMFVSLRRHLDATTHGEEGAFLICGHSRVGDTDVLLVRDWIAIPERAKVRRGRYGLEWAAAFSAEVLTQADRARAAVILVHSHGGSVKPRLSGDDCATARSLFPGFSRVLGKPCGAAVLGDHAASGSFWSDGKQDRELARVRVVGSPVDIWRPFRDNATLAAPKRRYDRMIRAIGAGAEARLAATSVGVIGLCGGGSHVCQQLAHMGFGRLVLVDHDVVEDVNLGRMVGSTPRDAGRGLKTKVIARLIRSIDPGITVEEVAYGFPAPATIDALKTVDLVVGCVDSFLVREQINTFCRRNHIPLIDIGLNIETKDERLSSAYGQLAVVTPSSACLRCGPLLSDAVLEKERRERPPGYDRTTNAAGAPQVVSMNGVLASEAVNSALDLVTDYSRGKRDSDWWLYDGRAGEMTKCGRVQRRSDCPACAEQGLGDPRPSA